MNLKPRRYSVIKIAPCGGYLQACSDIGKIKKSIPAVPDEPGILLKLV